MDMKLVIFLWCYFSLPFCFSRGGSFTDDHPDSSRPPTASSSRSDLVYSGRQQKSWKFDGYSSDNDVIPCVHFKAMFTLFWTAFLEQVISTHRTSCRRGWPRGSSFLNPSPYSWILLLSQWIPVLAPTYSRIPVHTAPKCGTEPIRYVTLHFRDRRGTVLLGYKNRSEITVLMCDQKPYALWFS